MIQISLTFEFFPLKNCMWVERVLAVAGVLREASWGLSCPVHCGGSVIVPFGAGFAIGILFGFLLSLLLVYYLHLLWSAPSAAQPSFPDPLSSSVLRRRARIAAYLHE